MSHLLSGMPLRKASAKESQRPAEKIEPGQRSKYGFFRFYKRWFKGSRRERKDGRPKEETTNPIAEAEDDQPSQSRAVHTAGPLQPNSLSESRPTASNTELTLEDVHALFSGAPHFSITEVNGQLIPTAEFPWDTSLQARDVSDHRRIGHGALSAATLRSHVSGVGSHSRATGYDIRTLEMPSMLSAQGTELGTVGFEYFLQDPVADALHKYHDEDEVSGNKGEDSLELLQSDPEELGLRRFSRPLIFSRLSKLSELYQEGSKPTTYRQLHETHDSHYLASLFDDILVPPRTSSASEVWGDLKAQIESLTNALRLGGIWYDFAQVSWRIRLGQIFWSDVSDHASQSDIESDDLSDYDILILQLLLACELFLRLDMLASMDTKTINGDVNLAPEDVSHFRSLETRKTRWDLVLARCFLENINVSYVEGRDVPTFLPRKPAQQLSGLVFFARSLRWPDVEGFESRLRERLQAKQDPLSLPSPIPSLYATPLSSPRSGRSSNRNSYFESRPALGRSSSQLSVQLLSSSSLAADVLPSVVAAASIGGWLSRSWFTGLVLPGEAISHLLISTLLENDNDAIRTLGDSATLYGGFVYRGRSWWSKYCIVGKVMACLPGCAECMGWISVPRIPEGSHDQWIDVASEHLEQQDVPRIKIDGAVKRDSDVLGDRDANASISPSELTMPRDPQKKSSASLWFEGLRLQHAGRNVFSGEEEDGGVDDRLYEAYMQFSSSSLRTELGRITLRLQHNVLFVSAYPCTPPAPNKLQLLKHRGEETMYGAVPGHPLHDSYQYWVVAPTDVLRRDFTIDHESNRVLVMDAGSESTLELFSRAWCSANGEHALISRVGTTCLACSIREARGLGIRVVIWIG